MQLCKRKDFSDEYKGSYKNRDEYDKRKKYRRCNIKIKDDNGKCFRAK